MLHSYENTRRLRCYGVSENLRKTFIKSYLFFLNKKKKKKKKKGKFRTDVVQVAIYPRTLTSPLS